MKTNSTRIFFIVILNLLVTTSFSQSWVWAERAGASNDDPGKAITIDNGGNLYTTGFFNWTVNFGTDTFTYFGGSDVFIAKYNKNGYPLWAKQAGGTNNDGGTGVATDQWNNMYVTGYFKSTSMYFDSDTLSNQSANKDDFFLAKYDSTGGFKFAISEGGISNDRSLGICTDSFGNVYLTGYFESTSIIFGQDTLINTNAPFGDMFVAKYDSIGNNIWAIQGNGMITPQSISCDASGNVYVGGYYGGSNIILGNDTLVNSGGYELFVAKFDSSGNNIWAKEAGGNNTDEVHSLTTDLNGNTFVTGRFASSSISFGSTTLTNSGFSTTDVFVTKYDALGNVIWAEKLGNSDLESAEGISLDSNNNVILAGYFQSSTLDIGSHQLVNNTPGTRDFFVAAFDDLGNPIGGISAGGSDNETMNAVVTGPNAEVYCTGGFDSDTIPLSYDTLVNNQVANTDFFLAEVSCLASYLKILPSVSICQGDSTLIYGNYENTPNTYFDSLQSIFGCDSIVAIQLFVNPLPIVTLASFNPDTLCSNGTSVPLPVGIPSGGNYTGVGIIGNNFNPVMAGVGTYTIVYNYSDSNNCTSFDTTNVTVEVCTEVQYLPSTNAVYFYPNPAINQINIHTTIDVKEIRIIDLTGKTVETIQKNVNAIDISKLPPSIYFIQIFGENTIVNQKFVIKKDR